MSNHKIKVKGNKWNERSDRSDRAFSPKVAEIMGAIKTNEHFVEELDFNCEDFSLNERVENIAAILYRSQSFFTLTSLDMSECQLHAGAMHVLASFFGGKTIPAIRTLSLERNRDCIMKEAPQQPHDHYEGTPGTGKTNGTTIPFKLRHDPKVFDSFKTEVFTRSGMPMYAQLGDLELTGLAKLLKNLKRSNVTDLNLRGNCIAAAYCRQHLDWVDDYTLVDALRFLLEGDCPVVKLNLGNNSLRSEGIARIAPALSSNSKLAILNLDDNKLTTAKVHEKHLQHPDSVHDAVLGKTDLTGLYALLAHVSPGVQSSRVKHFAHIEDLKIKVAAAKTFFDELTAQVRAKLQGFNAEVFRLQTELGTESAEGTEDDPELARQAMKRKTDLKQELSHTMVARRVATEDFDQIGLGPKRVEETLRAELKHLTSVPPPAWDGPLKELQLSHNGIEDTACEVLLEQMDFNKGIANLDLSKSKFSSEGVRCIAQAIRINQGITELDLSGNSIREASKTKAVKLDIKARRISFSGMKDKAGLDNFTEFARAVGESTQLRSVDCRGNFLKLADAKILLENLKENRVFGGRGKKDQASGNFTALELEVLSGVPLRAILLSKSRNDEEEEEDYEEDHHYGGKGKGKKRGKGLWGKATLKITGAEAHIWPLQGRTMLRLNLSDQGLEAPEALLLGRALHGAAIESIDLSWNNLTSVIHKKGSSRLEKGECEGLHSVINAMAAEMHVLKEINLTGTGLCRVDWLNKGGGGGGGYSDECVRALCKAFSRMELSWRKLTLSNNNISREDQTAIFAAKDEFEQRRVDAREDAKVANAAAKRKDRPLPDCPRVHVHLASQPLPLVDKREWYADGERRRRRRILHQPLLPPPHAPKMRRLSQVATAAALEKESLHVAMSQATEVDNLNKMTTMLTTVAGQQRLRAEPAGRVAAEAYLSAPAIHGRDQRKRTEYHHERAEKREEAGRQGRMREEAATRLHMQKNQRSKHHAQPANALTATQAAAAVEEAHSFTKLLAGGACECGEAYTVEAEELPYDLVVAWKPEFVADTKDADKQAAKDAAREARRQQELLDTMSRRQAMRRSKYTSKTPESRAAIMAEFDATAQIPFLPNISRTDLKMR
jgi:hypothetical protein